jgi:hypothetical protein
MLVIVAAALGGVRWAVITLIAAPLLGIVGLWIRERWRAAWRDVRRYLVLRRHPGRVRELRRRQRELAERFEVLVAERRRDGQNEMGEMGGMGKMGR